MGLHRNFHSECASKQFPSAAIFGAWTAFYSMHVVILPTHYSHNVDIFIRVHRLSSNAMEMRDTAKENLSCSSKMNTKHLHNFYLFASSLFPLHPIPIALSLTFLLIWCTFCVLCFCDRWDALASFPSQTHICTHSWALQLSCSHCPCPGNMQNIEFTQATNIKLDNVCKCLFVWKFLSLFSENALQK